MMKKILTLVWIPLLLTACTAPPPAAIEQKEMPKEIEQETDEVPSSAAPNVTGGEPQEEEKGQQSPPVQEPEDETLPISGLHEMLIDALHKEYRSHARYQVAIDAFESASPFPLVDKQAEEKISALQNILRKYNLSISKNPYLGQTIAPERVVQSCRKGKEGELETIAMYQSFLPLVTDYSDVQTVFSENAKISSETHVPLFNNCIKNETK